MAMDLFGLIHAASQQLEIGDITEQEYLARIEPLTDGYVAKLKQQLEIGRAHV